MTPEQRYSTELLRTGMNMILRPPALLDAFKAAIDESCDVVEDFTRDNPDLQAWHVAAVVTKCILRDHRDAVKEEWLKAYADLPPME